ncbi:MAG: glycosyltransferase family 39 protein [Dehalococcoidia bacterium]
MDISTVTTDTDRALRLPRLGVRVKLSTSRSAVIEGLVLLGLLALIFASYSLHLASAVLPNQDEGTYLYGAKLIAEGQVPYDDFFLGHPPLLMAIFAVPFKLFGVDVMMARMIYMTIILLSTIPLYLLVKNLSGSRMAALLSVPLYTTGTLIVANTTRTVLLEPLMNAFIISAMALYFWRPDSLRVRVAVGALFGFAFMVKLVAVLPAICLVGGDLLWRREDRRYLLSWAVTVAGAALVLLPSAAYLLSQTDFLHDVVGSQLDRPGLPFQLRREYFMEESTRYPAIPLALLASVWLLVRGSDPRMRVVAVVALGQVLILFFAFQTFLGFYLVQILPAVAIVFAVVGCEIGQRLFKRAWLPVGTACLFVVAGLIPLAYAELYHRYADEHDSSARAVVRLLQQDDGYVYSQMPSFALWSDRELYPWYYAADSYLPRITDRADDDDFIDVFSHSQALAFWRGEVEYMPRAEVYVNDNFELAYQDEHWELWVRKPQAGD